MTRQTSTGFGNSDSAECEVVIQTASHATHLRNGVSFVMARPDHGETSQGDAEGRARP